MPILVGDVYQGLVVRSEARENLELEKSMHNISPTLDSQGRLRAGAAIGTRETDKERYKSFFPHEINKNMHPWGKSKVSNW